MQGLTHRLRPLPRPQVRRDRTADYYAFYGYAKGARYTQSHPHDTAITAHAQRLTFSRRNSAGAVAQAMLARADPITPRSPASKSSQRATAISNS